MLPARSGNGIRRVVLFARRPGPIPGDVPAALGAGKRGTARKIRGLDSPQRHKEHKEDTTAATSSFPNSCLRTQVEKLRFESKEHKEDTTAATSSFPNSC